MIGGRFNQVGGTRARNIAAWDGTHWRPLGDGTDGDVMSLAVFNGDLIVGGWFTSVGDLGTNGIARWNGSAWSPLGSGLNDPLYEPSGASGLSVYGGSLIAAGIFSQSGATALRNVARWDGTQWSPLGEGINGPGQALEVFDDTLYVGGAFDSTGAIPAAALAKWDGLEWIEVGGGVHGAQGSSVLALKGYKDRLIVGGYFTDVGGMLARNIASWDGESWGTLDPGMDQAVTALEVHQDTLFISGGWGSLMRWDPTGGLQQDQYLGGFASCLLDRGDDLIVAGSFAAYDSHLEVSGFNVMRRLGHSWAPLESWGGSMHGLLASYGSPPYVFALTVYGGRLIASGYFDYSGESPGWQRVGTPAAWDGAQWEPMSAPWDVRAYVLMAQGDTLYAGGDPSSVDEPNPVYRLVSSTWTALDTLRLEVRCLETYKGELYAAGWRLSLDSPRNGGLYRWDGSHWQVVGMAEAPSEFPGILAMTEYDGKLVVGGLFSSIGGTAAKNVAAWDGTQWQALGPGVLGQYEDVAAVYSLGIHDGTLIAGGEFGSPLSSVVSWDGSTWKPMGNRIGTVLRLRSFDGELFAGGWLYTPEAPYPFDGVMHWDGTRWHSLGSGTNGAVFDLAQLGESIYMAGSFTLAGGRSSFGIAKWDGLPVLKAPTYSLAPGSPNPFRSSSTFTYTLPRSGPFKVVVFDLSGRQVAVLEDGFRSTGPHVTMWDGRDAKGNRAPSGVYFVHATFPDGSAQTRKTVRLR